MRAKAVGVESGGARYRVDRAVFGSVLAGLLLIVALGTATVTRNLAHNAFIVLCVLGVILLVAAGRPRRTEDPAVPAWLLAAFLAPLASMVLTLLFQPAIDAQSREAAQHFVLIGFAIACCAAIRRTRLPPWCLWLGLWLCVALSAASAAGQLIQHGASFRVGDARGKAIIFADISLAAAFMIAAGNPFRDRLRGWAALVSALALSLGILCASAALTRGALIFLPVGILLLLLLNREHPWDSIWLILATAIMLIIAARAFDALGALDDQVPGRFASAWHNALAYLSGATAGRPTSTGIRLDLWSAALEAAREYPWFGLGLGRFDDWLQHLASTQQISASVISNGGGRLHTHAHNSFMHTLATQGVVGLLALIFLLTAAAVYLVKSLPKAPGLARAGLVLIAAYCVFGVTESVFYHWQTLNFFLVAITAAIGLIAQRRTTGPAA